MSGPDQSDSEKAINRALMDVALRWGVDPGRADHNPVFWHDGALNYYDPISHREEVFAYLNERGILGTGFNGAYRLQHDFYKLDDAADADYERGVDIDRVISLIIGQLYYHFSDLTKYSEVHGFMIVSGNNSTKLIADHLIKLGYLKHINFNDTNDYIWTTKAHNALKDQYLMP